MVSDELLAATVPGAEASFGRELRGAVADVVDETFLATAATGIVPVLATASPDGGSARPAQQREPDRRRPALLADAPDRRQPRGTLLATNGNQLFPGMTPLGGEMLGLPALVSRSVPNVGGSPATDSLLLVDAAQIAADSAAIELDMSSQAALAMDSAPGMNALIGTGASTVSLFQSNCTALMAKVWFAAARLRTAAVAVLDGIAWSTRERIALIERRLMHAILGRDGPTATILQRELAVARSSTTVLDFADFRAALRKGTLRELVPTRGFTVQATEQQMADLTRDLRRRSYR